MKHQIRSKNGRFAPATPNEVKNGSLYGYRGTVVRARKACRNGKRLVSFHNQLFGFVSDAELVKIPSIQVQNYLVNAQNKVR